MSRIASSTPGSAATQQPQALEAPISHVADANILLRLAQPTHPMHGTADVAVRNLRSRGHRIVLVAQSLWEFYVVATRPTAARDGLGLSPADAKKLLDGFKQLFPLCIEGPIYDEWERLVITYNTQGLPAHDARYIAVMKKGGLTHLLTFNTKDFNRYASAEGITIVEPATVSPSSDIKNAD